LTAADLHTRFENYFRQIRHLKIKYADRIRLYAGMETETHTGYAHHIHALVEKFCPDYLVGSVHHVHDICFDYSKADYDRLVQLCGSHEALYEAYFDLQHEMITALRPFVVGHFDLIRIFDPDYEKRLMHPVVRQKIERNLDLIKSMGLVLDFNLRPLARGEKEPYIASSILTKACEMGIRAVPGDDSHSAAEAGCHIDTAIALLQAAGFDTQWPEPYLITQSA
jgi:histidinol-phosphatase (PHP family)